MLRSQGRAGEKLYRDVIACLEARVGAQRPVILVGHSLGGMVIKQFLDFADKRLGACKDGKTEVYRREVESIDRFMKNLCSIFYYSTPHIGCQSTDFAARLPGSGPVLEYLSKHVARLNDSFRAWREKYRIPTYLTGRCGWSHVIVLEASARQDSDEYYTISADHFNVCKPDSHTDGSFTVLVDFIHKRVLSRFKITLKKQSL